MRQRLALAQALLPRPQCLLLDEPTDGLDPEGIREFRQTVLHLRAEWGLTVLLNSHLLAEVDQMCDRCIILKEGRKVYEGVLSTTNRTGGSRYKLETPDTYAADAVTLKLGATLNTKGIVELPPHIAGSDFVKALVEGGVRVDSWGLERQSLEDIYLELTGKKK
jgi:ABC-2 type transport system ATP-binding protein